MSEKIEREEYISKFLEACKELWGEPEEKNRNALKITAKAVWFIENYKLAPEIEPVTLPNPKRFIGETM
jgi:hypothetical protein